MALEFELAGSQIDGCRDYQEDAFLITHLTDVNGELSALVVVADGMGGHAAGNVASNIAVQAFNNHVSANYPSENIAQILKESLIKANNSIKETIAETPALAGMGCTIVAAIIEGDKITWVSVGDSHCYLMRNKKLTKKNADHSYGGFLDRMEAQGTPIKPEPGLFRNMLMSSVTGVSINEIDIPDTPLQLKAGDRIILCSDGLNTLSSDKIIQYSESSESSKECADTLMQAVEDANIPKQDNTTVVVVNIKKLTVETQALEQPVTAQQAKTFYEQFKSKTALFIGIAAAVIILVSAAVSLPIGKKLAQLSELLIANIETQTTVEDVEEVAVEEVAEEEVAVEEVAVEETSKPEAVVAKQTTKKPVAKPGIQPVQTKKTASVTRGKTFQDTLKPGGKGPVMVIIPAGKFLMGSSSSLTKFDERPRHEVTVEKFAISQFEVTFKQYDQFTKATGRKKLDSLYPRMDRATHPVIFVSWDDAYHYTKWLSKKTGEHYRLASEAEWEYMASTGKKSPFWWGYDEEPKRAHCFNCGTDIGPRLPTRTGSFPPNAFGVYDTAGNVAEWVHDCWHDNYKGAPKYAEVWKGGHCALRIARGGAYNTPYQSIRSTKRDKFKSDHAYSHIGIRVARKVR